MAKNNASKTSFTLSAEAIQHLEALSVKLGISKTAVVEIAVRQKAKREGLIPPKPKQE